MRAILTAAMIAALAACQTTPPGQDQAAAGAAAQKPEATSPVTAAEPVKPVAVAGTGLGDEKRASTQSAGAASSMLAKRSVYYDFDKFSIRDEFKPLVEAHAQNLRAKPDAKIVIQGNADERGTREYNLALGQRRADGVKRALVLLGAKDGQIDTVSFGEEKPRATGHSEEAWAENRRSDLVYQGE